MCPGSNVPFWSLSYEVPYYLIFGLWFFGRYSWRLAAVTLLVAVGPYVAFLFSLWLVGLGCYWLCERFTLSPTQGRSLFLFSLLLLALSPHFAAYFSEQTPFGGGFISLIQFFLAGIPFGGCIIGFKFARLSFGRVSTAIRWAAGATFTIYLVHFPLGLLLRETIPSDWPLVIRWFSIFGILLLSYYAIAQFTERKKDLTAGDQNGRRLVQTFPASLGRNESPSTLS